MNSQTSLLNPTSQDSDIKPMDLSGDEGAQKSMLVSGIASKKANFILTVTTIMKTIIGTGILSLPYTVSRLGYILTPILFIIMILAAQFSSILLLKAKNLSKHSNYASIMYHIFRKRTLQALSSLLIVFGNTGVCIAELTLFKSALKKIIDSYIPEKTEQFYTQEEFIVLIIALLEIPLTLVNKIQKLKFMAFIGVTGILVFLLSLLSNFFVQMNASSWSCSKTCSAFGDNIVQVLAVIPNVMLSLCFHMSFFPIYKGMQNSRDSKMRDASLAGLVACSLSYISVGLMGACIYGRDTQSNFLLNFQKKDIPSILYILINGGFLISVFFSFPVMFFSARNNFINIIKIIITQIRNIQQPIQKAKDPFGEISSYVQNPENQKQNRRFWVKVHFYGYTLFLYAVIISIAILVDSIQDVFSIVGAISSNSIAFLLPTLFYFGQINKKSKEKTNLYYLSVILFVIFSILGLSGIISNFFVEGSAH